jgi:hypothetical protein
MLKKTCANNINRLSNLVGVSLFDSSFQSHLHGLQSNLVIFDGNTSLAVGLAYVPQRRNHVVIHCWLQRCDCHTDGLNGAGAFLKEFLVLEKAFLI